MTACGSNDSKIDNNTSTDITKTDKEETGKQNTENDSLADITEDTQKIGDNQAISEEITEEPEKQPEERNIPLITEISKGAEIYLGLFEQDADLENGPEPIEWKVLNIKNGKALLLSKYALEIESYSDNSGKSWAASSIRAWLYDVLYVNSFSEKEKEIIEKIQVENNEDVDNSIPGYEPTDEKIFILSRDEVLNEEYGFSSNEESDDLRLCAPTNYALDKAFKDKYGDGTEEYIAYRDKYVGKTDHIMWWLRTLRTRSGSFTLETK